MVIAVEYDSSGRIKRVIRSSLKHVRGIKGSGNVGIVSKLPKDVLGMDTNKIKDEYRVKDAHGYLVELEHGKG